MRKHHLQWLAEELGWLASGVTLESDAAYRLRTMSHPHFDHYWTWMDAPSTEYTLTPTAARVWYACDGTVSFGGASDIPQLTFTVTADGRREALAELLAQQEFEPMVWDRRVGLTHHQTKRWLEWIGEPTPGSEYKWCTDESAYEAERRAQQQNR